MKKILLLALTILIGLSAFTQIRLPGEKYPDPQFIWKQRPAVTPGQTQSFNKGTPRFKASTKGAVKAPTFDPTWANRFQTVLDSVMLATGGKGASMAVYDPEGGIWTGVNGISSPGVPITPDMRFGIGSNTKLFISATMLRLQEEGLLTLDDQLYQWLPSFQNIDSTTTIKQLLSHQSGIFDYWNDLPSIFNHIWDDTSRFWTTEEIINSVGPPHFAPGNGYSYSNTNYVLAGMIIEAATGETWVEKLHDVIFDPLNLDSTFVGAFESRNGPCASEWDWFANKVVTNTPMTAEYSQANACGAMLATATEMVQWYSALFNGTVISDSSLKLLLDFDPSSLYGLGIQEHEIATKYYYHSGGMCGFVSFTVYDLQKGSVISMLFNDRESDLGAKINALLPVFTDEYPRRPNDAGISNISSPLVHSCNLSLNPVIQLMNFGSEPLSSVSINYQVDENTIAVFNWTGLLEPGTTEEVTLPSITTISGEHTFSCFTSVPNGQDDAHTFNDLAQNNFIVESSPSVISELFEYFDGNNFPPEGWTVNSSSIFQWGQTPLARVSGTGSAVRANYNDVAIGASYDLDLPQLNISSWYNTDLSFDYAYAYYSGNNLDSLKVIISRDCGSTWQTLFSKGGYYLATVYGIYYQFYPQTPDEWKHVSFPLQAYEGDLLIRFQSVNGNGNNLFIDNIKLDLLTDLKAEKGGAAFSVYPNPFTSAITLTYRLSELSQVTLGIYDSYGRLVAESVKACQQIGEQNVVWNPEQLPAGIYYCRLQAGSRIISRKAIKMH